MAFHVSDVATDQAVRRLARIKGKTLTETIREAVEHEYAAVTGAPALLERVARLQARFREMRKPGGQPADKAFYDSLSGEC